MTGTIYLLLCVFFWLASPVCAGIYGSRVAETDAIVQLSICSTRHQASCDVEEYAGGMSAKTRARVGTDRRPRGAVLTCWCAKCMDHHHHRPFRRYRAAPCPPRAGARWEFQFVTRDRSHAIMDKVFCAFIDRCPGPVVGGMDVRKHGSPLDSRSSAAQASRATRNPATSTLLTLPTSDWLSSPLCRLRLGSGA